MRITAEQMNVLTYPFKGEALIQQAGIGSCYVVRRGLQMGEETKGSELFQSKFGHSTTCELGRRRTR